MGGEFIVASCDAAPLFELGEEAFDAPALLVGDTVVGSSVLPISTRWDNRFATLLAHESAQAIGVIGSVGEDVFGRQAPDQVACRCHVMLLARAQREAYRQPERIDYGVDFGAETTSGTSKSLGLNAPLFTLAPAA